MSAPYEFSITKTRMVQLVLCLGVIQILLYGSGVATGWLLSPRASASTEALRAHAVAPKIQVKESQTPEKQTPPEIPQLPAPTVSVETKSPGVSAAPSTDAAATSVQSSAPAQPPATESVAAPPVAAQSSPAPGVAVQVASFRAKSNAVRLADLLKKQGYGPVLVGESSGDGIETWHFVQLGPYKEWDEASRIVAEVDRSYAVHAYVRPIQSAVN
jgi:SPOR domain